MTPIYTNHALERIKERKFDKKLADNAFENPDKIRDGKEAGTVEFIKRFGNETITLIGKKNPSTSRVTGGEWVILSCWVEPPRPGTKDYKKRENWKRYQNAGFWGKLFLIVKQQLGF